MNIWTALLDLLILLLAAMVLGTLFERLKQSAILGYLLAGTLLGPNALDLMPNHEAVSSIAELGVALLLFTIGLEFSWKRLKKLGAVALVGGTMQVLITGAATASVCMAFGLDWRAGVALGGVVALSSTACVLRLLVQRAEMESIHGRTALGILLLQDIAMVPLVLVVTVLGAGDSMSEIGWEVGRAIGAAIFLAGALYVVLNYLIPPLLGTEEMARNRELPTLLAVVAALGAAWVAHRLGLSPALGAFMAGILLAESPFATQIRAEVGSLRTLFVTLFFSSIGMLGDPVWAAAHWVQIVAVVVLIVLGKTAVTAGVALVFRYSVGASLATGICLAQVGEFSFVVAEVAHLGGLIDGDLFRLIVSATIVTLFLTPYLVAIAPIVEKSVRTVSTRRAGLRPDSNMETPSSGGKDDRPIIILGFGPAAQRAAEALEQRWFGRIVIVELNPASAALAKDAGFETHLGDATRSEVLEHSGVKRAIAVIVAVPDPAASRHIVGQVRMLAPEVLIVTRARYHAYRDELIGAGADVAVDEEEIVGKYLASALETRLQGDQDRTQPADSISETGSG